MKICIYHKNCFDGICAAWVVFKKYPAAEFVAMNHGDEFPFHMYGKNDDIIMVDFSFKKHILLAITKECKSLLILDHHKSAELELSNQYTTWPDNTEVIFDMNESGASLAWKYFFNNNFLPLLVRYVKDRDLWLWKEIDSKVINGYIQSFPLTIESMEKLNNDFTYNGADAITRAVSGGKSIERYKASRVDDICSTAKLINIIDYEVPCVNTSVLFSEVPERLLELYPNSKFAVYYYDKLSDGIRQWGARSHSDFDVSEVAKKFGGGGHKNAAGWQEKL